jgi:hypothetical protein
MVLTSKEQAARAARPWKWQGIDKYGAARNPLNDTTPPTNEEEGPYG